MSRVKSTRDNIIFKYNKKDYYNIDRTSITNPFGRKIFSYDKKRTILDTIKNKNRVDTDVFSEAMKLYFRDNDRDLLKMSKYAIYMNMEE